MAKNREHMNIEFQVAQLSNSGQNLIQLLEKSGSEDGTSCENFLLEQQLKTHIEHETLPADKEAAHNAVAQGFSFNGVLYFVESVGTGNHCTLRTALCKGSSILVQVRSPPVTTENVEELISFKLTCK